MAGKPWGDLPATSDMYNYCVFILIYITNDFCYFSLYFTVYLSLLLHIINICTLGGAL